MRGLVGFLFSLGCGAAVVHGSSTPEPPPPPAPWVFSMLPPVAFAAPSTVYANGDGWVMAFGPVRVRVDGGTVEVAEEVTSSAIRGVGAFDGHWFFVTAMGEVFTASSPLGALSPIGTLDGRALGSVVSGSAHLAILDDRGHLFVGDASGIVRIEADGPVIDAAFATATFGGRIGADGRLLVTRGGGWDRVELPGAFTPYVVYAEGGELVVQTDGGTRFRIGEDGAVRAADAEATRLPVAGPDEAVIERAYRAASGFGSLLSSFTTDGRALALDANGRARVLPEGIELELPVAMEHMAGTWGTSFVAASDDGWVRSDGTAPFEPFAEGIDGALLFDDEGRRFVRVGRCPSEAAPSSGDEEHEADEYEADEYDEYAEAGEASDAWFVCVFEGEQRTEVNLEGVFDVLGIAGTRLYVQVEGGYLVGVDLVSGTSTVLGEIELLELAVTPDGSLLGRSPQDVWLWGSSLDAMVPVELPDDVTGGEWSLEALDARRAVARRDQRVFVTDDGGATFTEVPRAPWDLSFSPTACNAHGCLIGRTLWAPASFPAPNQPVVSIDGAATTVHGSPRRWAQREELVCDVPRRFDGHPLTGTLLAEPSPRSLYGRGWLELSGRGAFTSGAARGELGGLAEAGHFVAPVASTIPPQTLPHDMDRSAASTTVELLLATTSFAILSRSATVPRHRTTVELSDLAIDRRYETGELVIVPTRGAARVVGPNEDLVATWDTPPEVAGAMTLGEGAVVWLTQRTDLGHLGHQPDVLVVVAPDGSTTVHRFESGAVESHRVLARDEAGTPGLLVERAGEAYFLSVDGSMRGPMAPIPDQVSTPCMARVAGSIDVVSPVAVRVGFDLHSRRNASTHPTVTLSPDGSACLGEAVAPYQLGDHAVAALIVTAEPTGLVGRLTSSAGTTSPFECRMERPRELGRAVSALRLVPLAGGDVGLALMRHSLLLGTLHDGAWHLASTGDELAGSHFVLSDGGGSPIVLRIGPEATRMIPGELTPAEGVIGEARGTVLRVLPGTHELVAVRDGASGAPVRFGDRVAQAATLGPHGEGLGGIVTTCLADAGARDCQLTAIEVNGTAIGVHASTPVPGVVDGTEVVVADPSGRLGILAAVRNDERLRLEPIALDRVRPERVGPAIEGTDHEDVVALAARLGERTRVAYLDTPHGGTDASHVRVVELRRGQWWDVAPPLATLGRVAATFVGDDLVVVMAATDAVESRRLHEGAWQSLSITFPPPPAPAD